MTVLSYAELQTFKNASLLSAGESYMITDLGKIEIAAKTANTFHAIPCKRTPFAMDYDDETFDFDTKVLTGYDNLSCAVRCTNNAWGLINDVNHKPYKFSHASNNIMVHFSKQNTYDKVVGFFTTIDETYAASNLLISSGASVGLNFIAVYLYKTVNNLRVNMTLQECSIAYSNLWLMGRMSKNIQL